METVSRFLSDKADRLLRSLLLVLGVSVLFALSAWIAIRLPFTPVPISFTCQLILLASLLLGRRGAYATLAYLAQGAIGLPVFSNGGCGIAYLLGPTGGYLLGWAVAALLVGILSERMAHKTPLNAFALMLAGNALIFLFGLSYLALLVGVDKALAVGLYPFALTDLLKLLAASQLVRNAG